MIKEKNRKSLRKKEADNSSSIMAKINNYLANFGTVPLKEKLFFVRHLVPMLRVGISLSRALKTLSQQTGNKKFKLILEDVADHVEKGDSLTYSLKPHIKTFGNLFISMIEAGELSGGLENVLEQLYIQMKKENDLISKIRSALTYPIVILIAMVGIGAFMFVVVIPRMMSVFEEMNVELPLATRILIETSNFIVNNGPLVIIILIIFIFILFRVLKTEKGKYIFQGIILNFPIIGPIVKKINLARFARNISSLLKTDIMIIKTFKIASNVLGNVHYQKAVLDMSRKIKKGEKICESVKKYPKLFPPVVAQMITVGEETGELDNILGELADFYENDVDQIMKDLPSLIEPILILFLGLGVGGVATAVIMPMYSLSSTI